MTKLNEVETKDVYYQATRDEVACKLRDVDVEAILKETILQWLNQEGLFLQTEDKDGME